VRPFLKPPKKQKKKKKKKKKVWGKKTSPSLDSTSPRRVTVANDAIKRILEVRGRQFSLELLLSPR
jgi:hypothetical protein